MAIVVTETVVATIIMITTVMVVIQPPLVTVPMAAHMEVHTATLIQAHGLEVDHLQGTGIVDKEPTFETLDFTIRIGSTPTFLYFDLYLKILCLCSTLQNSINNLISKLIMP